VYRVMQKNILNREGREEIQKTRRDSMLFHILHSLSILRIFAVQNVLFF